MTYLAMIDRSYRGSIEAQFFDVLYGVLTFREQGVPVYVDERSVELLGLSRTALLLRVRCLDTTELACRWAEYEQVWFL